MATLGAPGAEQVTILLPHSLKYTKHLRMTIWQKLKDLWFCRALSRMIMKTTSPVTLNNLLHAYTYHQAVSLDRTYQLPCSLYTSCKAFTNNVIYTRKYLP